MYAPSHVNACATVQISTQGNSVSMHVYTCLSNLIYTSILLFILFVFLCKTPKIKMA